MSPPARIVCVECGGTCHLLTTWPPDDEPVAGDTLAYRCADCAERFDVVLEEDDAERGD